MDEEESHPSTEETVDHPNESTEPERPSAPATAFMLFMEEIRNEILEKEPNIRVVELARLGGQRWNSMTDEQKRPYLEKQRQHKSQFELAMEHYQRKTV